MLKSLDRKMFHSSLNQRNREEDDATFVRNNLSTE